MAFKKWEKIPEVMQEVEKLSAQAEKYNSLLSTKKTEDKIAAQKIWQSMAGSYWDILFALVEANTKTNPSVLKFDTEERLFIDLGYIPGILNLSKSFDSKKFLESKCSGGIFPIMTFSDYIAESWSSITGNESPIPSIGMTLDERTAYLQNELEKAQTERDEFMFSIAKTYEPGSNVTQIADNMNKFIMSCMKVNMRVPEYREGSESERQKLSQEHKAYADTSLLCQNESTPVDYTASYAILESMCRMDIDMFNVPRVRMYGILRAIFVPGQGLGTYDWSDHSLMIPAFPIGGEDKSVSYAIGTFSWDSDEDRKLKTPYENIKENRKKSLLALAQSFYKDYSLWMTKEKKGYRILPSATHKVFVDMFRTRTEE